MGKASRRLPQTSCLTIWLFFWATISAICWTNWVVSSSESPGERTNPVSYCLTETSLWIQAPSLPEGTRSDRPILDDSPKNSTPRPAMRSGRDPAVEPGHGPVDPPVEDHLEGLGGVLEASPQERPLVPLER